MTLTMTTGDTSPDLTFTVNADLTGATAEVHIKKPDNTVLSRAVTVTDAVNGQGVVAWVAGDTDQQGTHAVEVQVTFSNGKIQTFGPDTIFLNEQIA